MRSSARSGAAVSGRAAPGQLDEPPVAQRALRRERLPARRRRTAASASAKRRIGLRRVALRRRAQAGHSRVELDRRRTAAAMSRSNAVRPKLLAEQVSAGGGSSARTRRTRRFGRGAPAAPAPPRRPVASAPLELRRRARSRSERRRQVALVVLAASRASVASRQRHLLGLVEGRGRAASVPIASSRLSAPSTRSRTRWSPAAMPGTTKVNVAVAPRCASARRFPRAQHHATRCPGSTSGAQVRPTVAVPSR